MVKSTAHYITPPEAKDPPRYLDEKEASQIAGVSVFALRKWRWNGSGPDFFKLGRSVRYSEKELLEWLESRRAKRTGGVLV